MCVKKDFDENPPFRYMIRNTYNLNELLYNNVKKIDLKHYDKGEIELSKIEEWKRKVVNRQTDRKAKLKLFYPNVYHSLITFVVFSKFNRPRNKIDYDLSYIQYLDANNLYGWAMSQSLPTNGFKWMKNLTKEVVMAILDNANHSMINPRKGKGFIFEVDLEYPSDLWNSHNDYP